MKRTLKYSLLIVGMVLSGCSGSKKLTTSPHNVMTSSTYFTFGTAEADITPPPGYPMGGFGSSGRISRGVWTPLKAKSNYLRDKDGNAFAMVSCDLWSVPLGLPLRVGEILKESPNSDHRLGTSQILISATHTHHSHAAFHTSEGYNMLAAPVAGKDPQLFEWMAQKIAYTIKESVDNRRPAVVAKWKHTIEGLIRNRSYEAFDNIDPMDSLEIVSHVLNSDLYFPNPDLPAFVRRKEEFSAVDPYVTSLMFYSVGATVADPIAMINFCSFHPTVMGTFNELYSSDVFAVIEKRLKETMGWWNTSITFINGSEGDISCNWYRQDLYNTERIGKAIADSILSVNRTASPMTSGISIGYEIIPISERDVSVPLRGNVPSCYAGLPMKTAKDPLPGLGTVGGAEDGRTELYFKGLKEGMASDICEPGHANKEIAIKETVKHMFAALPPLLHPALEYAFKKTIKGTAPRQVPIGVHTIGGIGIVSLPGEITTTLGYHIKKAVAVSLGIPNYHDVLLSGLTNEYLSYFTSPAEYATQHYEGASTMYGFLAGSLLEQEASRLASNKTIHFEQEYKFKPGKDLHFDPVSEFRKVRWTVEESMAPYLVNKGNGTIFNHYPIFEFEDPNYSLSLDDDISKHYYPKAEVQVYNHSSGAWTTIIYDHLETSFAKFITGVKNNKIIWSVMWMPKPNTSATHLMRFKIITPDNQTIYSQSFDLGDILARRSPNKLGMTP